MYTGHNPEGPSHPQIPSIHHPDTPTPSTSYNHFYALERALEESAISEYHDQMLCLSNRFDLFTAPDTSRHTGLIQTPPDTIQAPPDTIQAPSDRGHCKKSQYLSIITKYYVCQRYLILKQPQTHLDTNIIQTDTIRHHPGTPRLGVSCIEGTEKDTI